MLLIYAEILHHQFLPFYLSRVCCHLCGKNVRGEICSKVFHHSSETFQHTNAIFQHTNAVFQHSSAIFQHSSWRPGPQRKVEFVVLFTCTSHDRVDMSTVPTIPLLDSRKTGHLGHPFLVFIV